VLLVVEPERVVCAAARESRREIGRKEIYIMTEVRIENE
jgi:hypothetical protein